MARTRYFVFSPEEKDLDEAFARDLADPKMREGLVLGAVDALHGLSQPFAPRLVRLLRTLFYGDAMSPPVPDIARIDTTWRTIDPRRALLGRHRAEIIIIRPHPANHGQRETGMGTVEVDAGWHVDTSFQDAPLIDGDWDASWQWTAAPKEER